MVYDEALAERIRRHVTAETAVTEKRMFGGLSFLLNGNLAVGVIGAELIVRVGPEATDGALARPGARPFDFTGRPMNGWVTVEPSALSDDDALARWIDSGLEFAAGLPPKPSR